MSMLVGLRHRLRVLLRPASYAREVDEEMGFHLRLAAEEREHRGLDADAARLAARRRFGNTTYAKEDVRRAAGLAWLDATMQDLRYAWRTLARSPGFALLAILTLALGIGSTTAIFGVVDSVVLRGLPYRDVRRLVGVYERSEDGNIRIPSYPTFQDWQAQIAQLSGVVEGMAFARGDGVVIPGSGGVDPSAGTRQIAAWVTPGFFQLLGTRPALGRTFASDEERTGAHVAVISWDFFLRRFGGDPAVLGTTIDVDSMPTTIIGVMPHAFLVPNFGGAESPVSPALWEPIAAYQATHTQLALRGLHADARAVLRIRADADSARAAAALHTVEQRLAATYPAEQAHWTSVALQPLAQDLYGNLRSSLLLLWGSVALVLLLACANVANLLLVRASVRARELTVRTALGASRWRLARQLLVEALVIAAAAGAAGVMLAVALTGVIRHVAAQRIPYAGELHVDARTALFAVAASLLTALLVGVAPALQASAGDLMARMRNGGAAVGSGRRERRVRHALVSVQFALAITLLIGAGLLLRSFWRLATVSLGYDPNGIIEFAISPPSPRYDSPEQAAALYARILDAMRALPGVTDVAATGGGLLPTPVETDAPTTGRPPSQAIYHPVSTDYLRTMRIPLLAGRWFTDDDMRSASGFVISERLAAQLWPGASPLGKRITVRRSSQARPDFGTPITLPVIGVIGDVREYDAATAPEPEVLLPYTLEVWPWMSFAVRARNAAHLVKAVEHTVRRTEPGIRFFDDPNVLESGVAAIEPQRRFLTFALSGFAAFALLLAAVGLYSIVAYSVVQRTRELSIRIALGAPRERVMSLVMREGAAFVVVGTALGLLGAYASTRLLRSVLFEIGPTDPLTFAAVPLLLGVVGLAASYWPAVRATRADPMLALRTE